MSLRHVVANSPYLLPLTKPISLRTALRSGATKNLAKRMHSAACFFVSNSPRHSPTGFSALVLQRTSLPGPSVRTTRSTKRSSHGHQNAKRLKEHLFVVANSLVTRLLSPDCCHPPSVTRLLSPPVSRLQINHPHSPAWNQVPSVTLTHPLFRQLSRLAMQHDLHATYIAVEPAGNAACTRAAKPTLMLVPVH